MNKSWIVSGLLLAAVVLSLGFVVSCGQSSSSGGAGVTSTNAVSGVVLVPATAVGASVRARAASSATAGDGVSTTPLAGATVQGFDPVTDLAVTDKATADADGKYTLTNVTFEGQMLIKATLTSGGNTTLVSSVASKGATADLNAGTTTAWNKIKSELIKKYGDLPSKATTISAEAKAALFSDLAKLFPINLSLVGTMSASSLPTFKYPFSDVGSIETEMFDHMPSFFNDYSSAHSTPALNTLFTSYLNSMTSTASSLAVTAAYPPGLTVTGFSGFIMPPISFPSGTKFGSYSDPSFFAFVTDRLSGISGAKFDCRLPGDLAGKLPGGAAFLGGVSFEGSGWVGSGKLPPSALFSGFSPSFLPSGAFLPPGASFEGISSFVLPPAIHMESGFIMPAIGSFGSGYEVPSNFSFASGFTMPVGVTFESGFVFGGSGMNFASGFVPPTSGISYAPGFEMKSGFVPPSGFVIPSGVIAGSGFVPPSGVSFAPGAVAGSGFVPPSGFVMPSGLAYGSGFVMPSGVSFVPGFVMPTGVSFGSGFVMPSGVSFGSGFVMPSGVSFGSGFVPPSGMSYQPGWVPPSGWIPPSGFVPPSG